MNRFTVDEVIADIESMIKNLHDKACKKIKTMVVDDIPFTVGFQDRRDGMHAIISEGIIPSTSSKMFKFFANYDTYVQYLPFIWKFNYLDHRDVFDFIVEMEFNLIGFTKNGLCLRRVMKKFVNRSYVMSLSVTDPNSRIVPFRDSAILFQAVTLEDVGNGCMIRDIEVIQPIPWLQSEDLNESLERFSYIPIRRMKSCLDFIAFEKTQHRADVIMNVAIERAGLELTLNGKHETVGEVWFESARTRVTCVGYVIDQASFIAEGVFIKDCTFQLTQETLLSLIFQNRCSCVSPSGKRTVVVHKNQTPYYQTQGEDITFSTFVYSEKCALVHFKSVIENLQPQDVDQMYTFGPSYIYLFNCDGKWNIQFNIKVFARTSLQRLNQKAALNAILQFLRNIDTSFNNLSPIENYKQPLKFVSSASPVVPALLTLPFALVIKVCKFLNKIDIFALSRTCKYFKKSLNNTLNTTSESGNTREDDGERDTVFKASEMPRSMSPHNESFNIAIWKTVTPFFHILQGHTNLIRDLDFDGECKKLVSGSSDRKIRLWNLDDFSCRTFVGPNSCLVSTKFTAKNYIASGYHCGTIRYINWIDSRHSHVFDVSQGPIEGFYPLEDMEFVVWNETVNGYKYASMHQNHLFSYSGHQRKVSIVRPYGKYFLSGSADRTIHIWNPYDAQTVAKIKAHKSGIIGLEPINEHNFVSAGNDKVISFWDDRMCEKPTYSIQKKICALSYHSDKIVCGSHEGKIYVYPIIPSNDCITLESNNVSGLISIACKQNFIAAGFKDGNIALWKY
ncbi:F-box and WD domain protein, putative [Entamoeba invadens IP1]|uniref:F-box and WD domain protein, putative n=1 Tax=Entamoeba invadens IP1 TaxID=370355 RepID=A0A0A1TYV1_ENTIV|nr:F-box and WD domain protein, putative [Entamoeba invadens IP1]ELP86658.1 F-box and WD domain protein, putative [Entamoeba invadens IP1]|eukprot:XP_004186004.1 F-box and WD domain protein, putative [Entamoeba invadens IP1]